MTSNRGETQSIQLNIKLPLNVFVIFDSILTDISNHLNKISTPENIVRILQMIIKVFERDLSETDVDLDQSENMGNTFNL